VVIAVSKGRGAVGGAATIITSGRKRWVEGKGTINGLRCSGDVTSATDDQLVASRAGGQTTPKEAEVEWRLEAAAKHD
jgi:hypothetical protein